MSDDKPTFRERWRQFWCNKHMFIMANEPGVRRDVCAKCGKKTPGWIIGPPRFQQRYQ